MDLRTGKVTFIGLGSAGPEDLIACAPGDERRRLMPAEVAVERLVLWDVEPVVVEEVQLDVAIAGTIEVVSVERPGLRWDSVRVPHAVRPQPLDGLGSQ